MIDLADYGIVHGIPSSRRDRWPLLVVSAGWFGLTIVTATGSDSVDGQVWSILAFIIGVIGVVFFVRGGAGIRKLSAAATIAYGTARSIAYGVQQIFSPIAVWAIVAGLALIAYRTSVRHDT